MSDLRERLQKALGARYEIGEKLGGGGAGIVYLAQDRKLGRKVALKVLRPEIGQSLGADRFLREIRISARLNHPHILSLIDSGTADGLLYYVMFHVPGETLRDRLRREAQLPVAEAVRLTKEVADALAYAHRQGVVHRDVKPENILLDEGHARVCDFGIARAIGEAGGDKLTRTGFALGTPTYMSPEQATGDGEADHRSDVYALGCVLYEMLVGAAPFAGAPTHVIIARKVAEDPPTMRVVRETIPENVERAVATALARLPADRFQSVEAFAQALDDPAYGRPRQSFASVRRLVRRAGALVAGAAAVAVGAMALLLMGRSEPTAALRTTVRQLTAVPGLEDSPSLSPDGEWVVYAGDDGVDRDIFLRSVGGERSINLTPESPADDHSPAFSPRGDRIAFRSDRDGGGIYVMGRTGEAVRRVTEAGHSPTWSPDGTRLAYVMEYVGLLPLNMETEVNGLWTVDLESGRARLVLETDAVLPQWSPDGRWIAYTSRTPEAGIWVISPEGGEPRPITDDAGSDWGPAWSPDGAFLYFTSDRGGSMNLWRLGVDERRGAPLGAPEPVTTPSQFAAHPTVAANGGTVVFSSVLTTQNVVRAPFDPVSGSLGEPFALTTGTRQWSSPDPSPDGSTVAFYSRDLPEGDLYVVRRDGTGLRQITGDSAIDRVPRWSPDGDRLAYFSTRSGALQLWLVNVDGSGNRQLTYGEWSGIGDWSPDGTRLAVASPDGTYLLDLRRAWEDQTPEMLAKDSTWGRFVSNDWSPDGTRLAGMVGYTDNGVGYYEIATRRHVKLTDFGQWPVWLPDSRRILFVSGGSAFWVVDGATGDVTQVHSVVREVLGPPRLTADGREVVYTRRVTEGDLWVVTLHEGS